MADKQMQQNNPVEILINFTGLHKMQPEPKAAGHFQNLLKTPTFQISTQTALDDWLNISQFQGGSV